MCNKVFLDIYVRCMLYQKSSIILVPGSSKVMRYKALCVSVRYCCYFGCCCAAALHRHVCVYCYDFSGLVVVISRDFES